MLRFVSALVTLALATAFANAGTPNLPPLAPVITEPRENRIINAADVHMECLPMQDPNPEDLHKCSDWRIVDLETSETVWLASCAPAELAVHIHLGDGVFLGDLDGERELAPNKDYVVQVRHFDSSGDPETEAGPWSTRPFRTAPASVILPYVLTDVLANPMPEIVTESGSPLAVPTSASIHLLIGDSTALEIRGDGATNEFIDFPAEAAHFPATLLIHAGEAPLNLPAFDLSFTDATGASRTIYAPQIILGADEYTAFWIESTGATWERSPGDLEPNFETLARGLPIPWQVLEPGFVVEEVAGGFTLPMTLSFANIDHHGRHEPGPDEPYLYVGELYGAIKVITFGGEVKTYASELLNFNPFGPFPGSGEIGIGGIAVEKGTGHVYVSMVNRRDGFPLDEKVYPRVERLESADGGITATTRTIVMELTGFPTVESHQISNLTFLRDGTLLVHNGDAFRWNTPLNLFAADGKILRIDRDGNPPPNNPFYDASDGISMKDFVYAYGFRNPFGGTLRLSDGLPFVAENGPSVDRLAVIRPGESYGYDGSDASMYVNATYTWIEPHAPVGVAVTEWARYGRSGYPAEFEDAVFVAETGPTWASGTVTSGKQIRRFKIDHRGDLHGAPQTFLTYIGNGRATACALQAGPDGLYFTELYRDLKADSPVDSGARVMRVRYRGKADFKIATPRTWAPAPPLDVSFTSTEDFPGTPTLLWDFGDGTTSTLANPTHRYTEPGEYTVSLRATGPAGNSIVRKDKAVVIAESTGLLGEYFDHPEFQWLSFKRLDRGVAFPWGHGSPSPKMDVDTFSVRWTGHVLPRVTGSLRLIVSTDDGCRLFVGDELRIDSWRWQGEAPLSTWVDAQAGVPIPIRFEYFEAFGISAARLGWVEEGGAAEYIPASQLFAPANLRIEEQSMRNVTAVGDVIQVHTRIANDGPGVAVFPVLHREWPGFLRPVGASELSLPNIDPGEEISITMFAEAIAVGDGISTATITMSGYEMDRSDDVSTIFIVSTGDTGTGWFAR